VQGPNVRLLVALHHLELGGSQLNALDLAVAARGHGHDVITFAAHEGKPGPVAEMARAAELPLVLMRHPDPGDGRMRVRRAVARRLSEIVAQERIELVHAYEIQMILDSFYGPHLGRGVPLVCTIYGNWVPWWLPRYPPLVVVTRGIAEFAAPLRKQCPVPIEPPVNTDVDNPALVNGAAFRHLHGLGTDIVVGIVSRLEPTMKAPGIELAMDAVELLHDPRIRLVVTGEGPSFDSLNERAERVNDALGRRAVIMTGPLVDPRPAYAAADIALGMGGSALRAMAFGKPLIVLGVEGFAKPCGPSSAQEFVVAGFYGIGSGDFRPDALAEHIRELADQPELRSEIGRFSSELVGSRFSLKAASASLEKVYSGALTQAYPRQLRLREAMRASAGKIGSEAVPAWLKNSVRPLVASRRLLGYVYRNPVPP
jgi:glycosyltransferase involved in cell wall biosynthesis